MAIKCKQSEFASVNIAIVLFVLLCIDKVYGHSSKEHICNHQHPKAHEVIHGVHLGEAHTIRKRNIDNPLRILLYYDESVYRGRSIEPFCAKRKGDPLHTECTNDRNSVALCNLIEHQTELPKEYQNFDTIANVESGREGYFGGSVSLADHCPYIQEFTWRNQNVVVRGSQCLFEDNNPKPEKNFALESYGEQSKCFDHTDFMWEERNCTQTREWRHWGSGCYKYKCENRRLHILVSNYSYECFYTGQEISIRIMSRGFLHHGGIVCPPCQEICGDYLERIGLECRIREEAPPANKYPRDDLTCSGNSAQLSTVLVMAAITFTALAMS